MRRLGAVGPFEHRVEVRELEELEGRRGPRDREELLELRVRARLCRRTGLRPDQPLARVGRGQSHHREQRVRRRRRPCLPGAKRGRAQTVHVARYVATRAHGMRPERERRTTPKLPPPPPLHAPQQVSVATRLQGRGTPSAVTDRQGHDGCRGQPSWGRRSRPAPRASPAIPTVGHEPDGIVTPPGASFA